MDEAQDKRSTAQAALSEGQSVNLFMLWLYSFHSVTEMSYVHQAVYVLIVCNGVYIKVINGMCHQNMYVYFTASSPCPLPSYALPLPIHSSLSPLLYRQP